MSRPHNTKTAGILWIVILLSLAVLVFFKLNIPRQKLDQVFPMRDIKIAGKDYHVYEARTPLQREIGLSAFNTIKDDEGMLFYFDSPGRPAFWMKDMKFPIDIVWMKDWVVAQVNENVSVENVKTDGELRDYFPANDINEVLEIKAGQSQQDGIGAGSILELK
jgi:uncharacterized membrane protein (UPF0127 family)